ncbi:leukemia NUP98 fusion partner 1 isoform X2 [Nerophis lumbriciformis]|uniref:leukemia NUP98 fusion partner 1 isoform X2 n=1 Tax=Nerophis lumbriciformis TaxID=546530 RepID=UPI002ADF51C5|nr:leukemia NUP98 fusion partner 1-like isoform X2 [Nerophis lumbriciformis]
MALRLLPAIITDNDEDDDGNFTKWMSSYWGHGAEGGRPRDRKHSFRRPARTKVDRRASLPTVSQLDAMKLKRLHANAMAPAPVHGQKREEKGEVRGHQRARRASSDDSGRHKSATTEKRISTIPELTESLEKRLSLQDKHTMVVVGRRSEQCRAPSGSEAAVAAACLVRRLLSGRRRSADEPVTAMEGQHTFRRQLSLRRHR